jgi:hypothetical protein
LGWTSIARLSTISASGLGGNGFRVSGSTTRTYEYGMSLFMGGVSFRSEANLEPKEKKGGDTCWRDEKRTAREPERHMVLESGRSIRCPWSLPIATPFQSLSNLHPNSRTGPGWPKWRGNSSGPCIPERINSSCREATVSKQDHDRG